jgi:hypothetical protein
MHLITSDIIITIFLPNHYIIQEQNLQMQMNMPKGSAPVAMLVHAPGRDQANLPIYFSISVRWFESAA